MSTEIISQYTPDQLYSLINPEDVEDEDELYEMVEEYLVSMKIEDNGAQASLIFDYIMEY